MKHTAVLFKLGYLYSVFLCLLSSWRRFFHWIASPNWSFNSVIWQNPGWNLFSECVHAPEICSFMPFLSPTFNLSQTQGICRRLCLKTFRAWVLALQMCTNKLPLHEFGFPKKTKKSVHVKKSVPKRYRVRMQSLPGITFFNSHLPNSTNVRVQLKATILASKNESF